MYIYIYIDRYTSIYIYIYIYVVYAYVYIYIYIYKYILYCTYTHIHLPATHFGSFSVHSGRCALPSPFPVGQRRVMWECLKPHRVAKGKFV